MVLKSFNSYKTNKSKSVIVWGLFILQNYRSCENDLLTLPVCQTLTSVRRKGLIELDCLVPFYYACIVRSVSFGFFRFWPKQLGYSECGGCWHDTSRKQVIGRSLYGQKEKTIIFHEITEIKLIMYQFNYLLVAACYAFSYMNFDVQVSVPQTKRRRQGYFRRQSRNHSSSQCEALIASSCQKEASLGSLFQPKKNWLPLSEMSKTLSIIVNLKFY